MDKNIEYIKKLIPLYVGAAIGPMGALGIVTLLPVLANNWSIDFSAVSLSITFYLIPYIVIQFYSGTIAQLYDVRKTIFFGFTIYALGALLCGFSGSLWVLIISRIIQGIGAATGV